MTTQNIKLQLHEHYYSVSMHTYKSVLVSHYVIKPLCFQSCLMPFFFYVIILLQITNIWIKFYVHPMVPEIKCRNILLRSKVCILKAVFTSTTQKAETHSGCIIISKPCKYSRKGFHFISQRKESSVQNTLEFLPHLKDSAIRMQIYCNQSGWTERPETRQTGLDLWI